MTNLNPEFIKPLTESLEKLVNIPNIHQKISSSRT